MKTGQYSLLVLLIVSALAVGSQSSSLSAEQSAAAFSRLKSLAGEWEGKSERGGKVRLIYEVTSRGSAVLERYEDKDPPPGEVMLTVYYLDGARLLLTHHCVARNQPRMVARRYDSASGELDFDFLDATNLSSPGAGHMHAIRMRFVDADHLLNGSDFFQEGKLKFAEMTPFTRVR